MARKKSRRAQLKPKKVGGKIETRYNCPKCNNEQTIQCKIDKNNRIGTAYCIICEASFNCKSHSLMHSIDIYSSWIDELEKEQ